MTTLLDPTAELRSIKREKLPRPASLDGLTVGLLDISKARGSIFLDQLEAYLAGQGVAVRRYRKPTFARVAPAALRQQIVQDCDAVIEALAD